jgi:N-acetylmuramoyl-L-alanine amidase
MESVLMYRIARGPVSIVGVAALCLLAGCRSGSPSLQRGTTDYLSSPAGAGPVVAPSQTVTSPLPAVALSEPLTVAPPVPLVVPPVIPEGTPRSSASAPTTGPSWPSNWVNAWIALESWSAFNGLTRPRQLSAGLEAAFALETERGPLFMKMGSHAVRLGGVEYWLGFAPKLIRGLPYVHALDARKTLQPLVAQGPTTIESNGRVVVIDPGHGGKDGGAKSSANGDYEKNYALDCARRLQSLLEARGWRVVLTRTNDSFIGLLDRVAIAEQVKADVFVSVHFNSGTGNGAQSGVETFCLTPNGMPSTLLRETSDDPRERHPNNAYDDQNFNLAVRVHRSVLEATGAPDRGVRRARFMAVLRGQNRPAVLVEAGYLTNAGEARKIATTAYRQAIAEGIAKALE